MRVLIVKTSSMGDVIHTLPALTDAQRAIPNIIFDWVVEESFQEIPSWHPAVDRVLPIAIRRWRKNIFKTWRKREVFHFAKNLRKCHYDLVIDAQGLVKSAWAARLAKTPIAGYDKDSAREPLARLAYHFKYAVPREMHAVERTRELFAAALGYQKPTSKGDYGLDKKRFQCGAAQKPYVVFLHATTRDDKHYPQVYWRQLCAELVERGLSVRLPWGNESERLRAEEIAAGFEHVEVLPKLNIRAVGGVLVRAKAVVAVDTGLGHLSAALDVPTVSLYGPTSPGLIGAYGRGQVHLSAGDLNQYIEQASDCNVDIQPAVFAPLKPGHVLDALDKLITPEVSEV